MLARALTVTALAAALAAPAARAGEPTTPRPRGVAAAVARDPITPLRDIHRGMRCTARTVVEGTEITSFDVEVLDVLADVDGTGPRILVRVSGPAVEGSGIASGFSGSPTYCPDSRGLLGNAGAVSATVGQYGNDVGLVTPIEQMLGLPVAPPSGARSAPRAVRASVRPLSSPITIAGLSPPLARLVEQAAHRVGRSIVAAPVSPGPLGTFPPQQLVPGASMAVAYSTGALAASAIGTVTYRDGPTLYGFGHLLDGAGRRSLPLQDAYVFAVIDNPLDTSESTSYKLAAPGHTLGTISDDALPGVVGTVGRKPATTPFTVTVRDRDRGRTLRQRTDVADEVDVGDPLGQGTLPMLGPLAIAQAVTSAFDGAPARETGRLCLTARVREARRAMRFCNRYVVEGPVADGLPPLATAMSADATTALEAIDKARFAGLHVTSAHADVTISRGLRLATILAVRGSRTVRRGGRARLALRVREVRGPLRTIPLTLRIPRDARLGARTLQIGGSAIDEVSSGGDELTIVIGAGGGPSSGAGGAQSMREVAAGFARAGRFDGLRARLGSARWRAGRDPQLRIDGRGTLRVRVLG